MAFEFEDEVQPAGGQFVFEDAPAPTPSETMQQAGSRQLPPLWYANVGGVPVRGVFDADAKAYLVANQQGKPFYIAKDPQGELTLKPYTGKPSAAGTGSENFWAGFGKAAVDTKRGIQQLGALVGNTLGVVDNDTVDQTFADAKANQAQDADLMKTKAGLAGNIAGNIGTSVVGGTLIKGAGQGVGQLGKAMVAADAAPSIGTATMAAGNTIANVGKAITAPQSFKQAAAVGAGIGALQPSTSLADKAKGTALGAAAGLAGQGIAQGVSRAAKGASDVIGDEVKNLAQLARDKWGIAIRGDQVLNSKPVNAVSAALDYIPFSGSGASKNNLQKQFNTALAKSIGETSDNPAFAIKQAEDKLGAEFDRVLQATPVKADDAFTNEMAGIMQNARNEMTDQQFGVMQRQMDNILGKVQAGDVIDAQAAYNIKKGLDRIGKSNDSTLATYATEMKKALMDALNRSLGPEEAAKFAATRGQYSNLMALRKIVPRGAEADISPARLANMKGYMTQDLNELADIAATFLKPRVGDSGTAQRLASMAAVGGGVPAAAMNPALLIPAGLGIGAARGLNKMANSPAATKYLMEGSKRVASVQPIADVAPVALPAFLASYLQSQK